MLGLVFYLFIVPVITMLLIVIIVERNDYKKVELLLKEKSINEENISRGLGNINELLFKRKRIERALESCEYKERFSHLTGNISDEKYLEYRKKNWMMCNVDRIEIDIENDYNRNKRKV